MTMRRYSTFFQAPSLESYLKIVWRNIENIRRFRLTFQQKCSHRILQLQTTGYIYIYIYIERERGRSTKRFVFLEFIYSFILFFFGLASYLFGASETTSTTSGNKTHPSTSKYASSNRRIFTNIPIVTITMRILSRIPSHTSDFWPTVLLWIENFVCVEKSCSYIVARKLPSRSGTSYPRVLRLKVSLSAVLRKKIWWPWKAGSFI